MCAKHKSVITSRCEDVSEDKTSSPVPGNTIRSGYRVLGGSRRRDQLSVDRNCASRKALSGLKVSSPDKLIISVVAMRVCRSEATPRANHARGTTGVQVHGEYRRRLLELGRSPAGRAGKLEFRGQRVKPKSEIIFTGEVRWPHSSEEVR